MDSNRLPYSTQGNNLPTSQTNQQNTSAGYPYPPPSQYPQMANPQQLTNAYPMQNPNNTFPAAYPGMPTAKSQNMHMQYPYSYQQPGGYPVYPGTYDLENSKMAGGQPPVIIVQQAVPAQPKTGTQRLEELEGIFIKQKLEVLEVVTGCETENTYYIYALDKNGNKKSKKIFKCKERSNTCARLCLPGDCRPYRMDIYNYVNTEDEEYVPFLHIERPCKCTCLCFNRPYVSVTLNESGRNEYLGRVIDPWNCCNIQFNIFDSHNTKKYEIDGGCCQLGMWINCPCEPCQNLNFDIKSGSGEVVSKMQKKSPGCIRAMATDDDNYSLKFPANTTIADKALLISAVLFMDYRHFEQRGNKREINR